MAFVGTVNQLDTKRTVSVEAHSPDCFATEILSGDCFSMIIIKSGSLLLKINDVDCHVTAPAVLCLDELKMVTLLSDNNATVRIIKFDPQFLNVNMLIRTLRSRHYKHLCQQHAFFQLSPFLTDDVNKLCIRLSQDTLEKFEYSFDQLAKNLQEQKDWYWSCRARSYFIDMINLLERLYHDFYLEESYDTHMQVEISSDFRQLLTYVNANLAQQHTLESLYRRFHINKNQIEQAFRETMNTTFYEYLRNRRYEQAAYYLRFTELDGTQIASRIGFSSSQNFCKFFKQMSGTTPKRFRQETVSKRKNDTVLFRLNHTVK